MKKKRIIIFGGLGTVLMFLIVCGVWFYREKTDSHKNLIEKNELTTGDCVTTVAYTNIGLFEKKANGLLLYTDGKTEKSTYVCNKANCQHEGTTEGSGEATDCEADIHEFTGVIQNGNYIYLIGNEDKNNEKGDFVIYREDLNGENREKVMSLKGITMFNTLIKMVMKGTKLAITYYCNYEYDKKGALVEKKNREEGIILIDIKQKKYKKINLYSEFSSPQDISICDVSMDSSYLYCAVSYYDKLYQAEKAAKLSSKKQQKYQLEHRFGGTDVFSLDTGESVESEDRKDYIDGKIKGNWLVYTDKYGNLGALDIYPEGRDVEYDQNPDIEVASRDEVRNCDFTPRGIMGSKVYYSKYSRKNDTSDWYSYDLITGKKQFLCTTKTAVAYISEKYFFAAVQTSKNGHKENTAHIVCLKPKDFCKESFTDQKVTAAKKNNASESSSVGHNTVVWTVVNALPSSNAVSKINQILKKKGYNFHVTFNQLSLNENEITPKLLEKRSPETDIMQVPVSYFYEDNSGELIKNNYFIALDSFLKKRGSKLYDSMPAHLWNQVKYNDKIYVVPSTQLDAKGIYFIINKKYVSKKLRKNFEGTLSGVSSLLSKIDTKGVSYPIALDASLSQMTYGSLVDGQNLYGMCFSEKNNKVEIWNKNQSVYQFYQQLNKWVSQKLLSKDFTFGSTSTESMTGATEKTASGDFIVDIGNGELPTEFIHNKKYEICWADDYIYARTNCSAGVTRTSSQSENAKKFLMLAYTDRNIANLMQYGVKGKDYQLKNGIVTDYDSSFLTGLNLRRLSMGNKIACSPVDIDKISSYWKDIHRYFHSGKRKDSKYLGFFPDIKARKSVVKKLMNTERENENIWKSNSFKADYKKLLYTLDTKENREYLSAMQKQLAEWEK